MKICNKDELRLFEDTLEQCKSSVLVLTPEGNQFDLKNPMERYPGIASLIGDEDPELYASCYEDEMKLFRFLEKIA